MRNPLWVLVLGLALLFLTTVGVILLTRKQPPARKSLTPSSAVLLPQKSVIPIDLSRIYENDLFRTYRKPLKPIEPEKFNLTPPPLPQPATPPAVRPTKVQFLDPLAVSLKGIIISNDEKTNRAILADEKTKKEDIYSVGDILEDAEIIRIEREKVILIRSNGQQETIFLTVRAAGEDPVFMHEVGWDKVVRKITEWSYAVDPQALKNRLKSLAHFIDMLDITGAFDKGISVGCRIGRMPPDSLGIALGFHYGDLVTAINDMPLFTTQERVAAYQALKNLSMDGSVRVTLTRNRRPYELLYVLKPLAQGTTYEKNTVEENAVQSQPVVTPSATTTHQPRRTHLGGRSAWLQRT